MHLNRAGDGAIAPSIQGRIFRRILDQRLDAVLVPPVGAVLFARTTKTASDPSGKILKFNGLKIFYRPRNRPLEIKRRFSKSFFRRAPNRARHTGAGGCPATFVSMLLNGGCGYEEPEPRSFLADQHRLRPPIRPNG
jgi:hypothetical protein